MIYPKPLDKLLAGQRLREYSDTRFMIKMMVESSDREVTAREMVELTKKLRIPYVFDRATGSSFPALQLTVNNKPCRITFKNVLEKTSTVQTARMEAAQCLWLAVYQSNPQADSNFVRQNWQRYKSSYKITTSEKDIWEHITKEWERSHNLVASHLIKKLRGSNYVFHHDTAEVRKIYACYNRLNRQQKIFSSKDKWNPADIWAISRGMTLNLDKIDSFDEFNNFLREGIDKGNVVPISLKQVRRSVKISTHNTTEDRSKPKEETGITKYVDFRVNTGAKDWTSSKSCIINLMKADRKGKIELRSFKAHTPVMGELNMHRTSSRSGKIKQNVIENIFMNVGHQKLTIPHMSELYQQMTKEPTQIEQRVYELAEKLDSTHKHVSATEYQQFLENLGKQDQYKRTDWIVEKYTALLICDAFSKIQDKEKVVEALYSWASASGEIQGPFLKADERV